MRKICSVKSCETTLKLSDAELLTLSDAKSDALLLDAHNYQLITGAEKTILLYGKRNPDHFIA